MCTNESWMKKRHTEAIKSLEERGVPPHLLKSKIQIHWFFSCRAYVYADTPTVHIATWWAFLCYLLNAKKHAVSWLRHELAHIIVARVPEVSEAFDIPDYPPTWFMNYQRIKVAIGILKYEDTTPEEKFATRVQLLRPSTIKKLVNVLHSQ